MLAEYCWSLKRDVQFKQKKRKRNTLRRYFHKVRYHKKDQQTDRGHPASYSAPRKFIILMTNTRYVLPNSPTSDWLSSRSRPGGVKQTTDQVRVGNQLSNGKWTTEINIWKSVYLSTWNVLLLLEAVKFAIVEQEISKHSIVGLSETHQKGSGYFISKNNICAEIKQHTHNIEQTTRTFNSTRTPGLYDWKMAN